MAKKTQFRERSPRKRQSRKPEVRVRGATLVWPGKVEDWGSLTVTPYVPENLTEKLSNFSKSREGIQVDDNLLEVARKAVDYIVGKGFESFPSVQEANVRPEIMDYVQRLSGRVGDSLERPLTQSEQRRLAEEVEAQVLSRLRGEDRKPQPITFTRRKQDGER